MNPLALALAIVLLVLGLAAYPPGISPLYTPKVETLQVSVPPSLVEKGYPRTVLVSREYFVNRFGGDYGLLLNATFTPEGIYDASRGRIIGPQEASYTVVGCRCEPTANPVKVAFLVGAVVTLAAALAPAPTRNGGRLQPAGGYVP
ncbi:MAG: hypothetical protein ACP5KY_07995 [Thermoproteus sp.]